MYVYIFILIRKPSKSVVVACFLNKELSQKSFNRNLFRFSSNCEYGAPEQTADYVLTACPTHWAPEARSLIVLDDQTQCWLDIVIVSI